ncbi:uncharacterized protein [Nerophis lumbriciformis]|uniref:uncharacterized protein isoform X2 n=1 Tax=Nerophis lumbriciformis TaxID=546530 RepID=UPI002ADF7146|nr:uncharacterized protein LOC133574309 isoform X2 [Nerophis lumbriciformis]
MASKRLASSKAPPAEPKRRRKMLTIVEKVELLDMLKLGKSYTSVGRHYGINESTVRYIKKDEKNIRATAAITLNKNAKRVVTPRNKTIVKMESVLAVWISECKMKNIRLDTNIIRTKAKKLYEDFAKSDYVPDGCQNDAAEEGQVRLAGGHGEAPGHIGKTMSAGWPGNASGSPEKSWTKWLGRGKSGLLCLGCCPRNPTSDKRKKMDTFNQVRSAGGHGEDLGHIGKTMSQAGLGTPRDPPRRAGQSGWGFSA